MEDPRREEMEFEDDGAFFRWMENLHFQPLPDSSTTPTLPRLSLETPPVPTPPTRPPSSVSAPASLPSQDWVQAALPSPVSFDRRYVPPSQSAVLALEKAGSCEGGTVQKNFSEAGTSWREPGNSFPPPLSSYSGYDYDSEDYEENDEGEREESLTTKHWSSTKGRCLPSSIELFHHIADLQRMAPGPCYGGKTKQPHLRRAYAVMRMYCNSTNVTSVLALYSLLGGNSAGVYCFRDVKAFIVYEVGTLVSQAFSTNHELLFRFLSLFDD